MTNKPTAAGGNLRLSRWLILAVICIPVFVGSLDLTIVSAFLPELINDLQIDPLVGIDDTAWIVSAYLMAYTISLTFMGRVSDLLGRRWVYAICLLIFIAGSVLVAVAHQWPTDLLDELYRRTGRRPDIAYVNLQAIIIGRVVQALGAGALVPVSLALVGDLFPPNRRAQPMGVVAAVDTLGWVLGHLYGGLFIQIPGVEWQHLFWINVPVTLFALFMTLWALRNVPQYRSGGSFDFFGMIFIVGAIVAFNVGLGANIDVSAASTVENLSQLPPYALPLLVTAVVLFFLFILVESRVKYPLIDLHLIARRNVWSGLLTNLFVGYCLFIGLVIVPILVNVRQESVETLTEAALQVGLMLSALTIPMALAAVPGGWLSERIGYSRTTISGLVLAAVGLVLVWQTWTIDLRDTVIVVEMIIIGVGIGLTFSPISAAVINAAGDHERGVASALVLIVRLIGMTISVSTLSTFASNRVFQLAEQETGVAVLDDVALTTVARLTVDVLAEIGLVGAILAVVAIIPAAFIRPDAVAEDTQPVRVKTTDQPTPTPLGD
jgi:MFS family permease